MRVHVTPSRLRDAELRVPGDKSIAHRWLILAAVAEGRSDLIGVPAGLDLRSTARCLAQVNPRATTGLSQWVNAHVSGGEVGSFTWDEPARERSASSVRIEGEGWDALRAPSERLDCGNSGTTMRLLMGLLSAGPGDVVFVGDESLSRRPMERVAEPLRRMGADIRTTRGTPPVTLHEAAVRGIDETLEIASSQVKSAILLAALRADGETIVRQASQTRDHTERALLYLGAAVTIATGAITVHASDVPGFRGVVPGDPSSAAFLIVAAAIAGSALRVREVGMNPTRTAFLDVLREAGCEIEARVESSEVGEPVGELLLAPRTTGLRGLSTSRERFPLLADEIPALAVLAAAADGPSRFSGAGELRVKESDRLSGIVEGLRALGADAAVEGDDLVVAGGGIRGGSVDGGADHRLAMAFAIAATAATDKTTIEGIEAAEVSFPGFLAALRRLGAEIDLA
ncbi:MAG: 3-phosphoshikimate 1-carboxyvinyltransferase [Actinomycetota bacterium]